MMNVYESFPGPEHSEHLATRYEGVRASNNGRRRARRHRRGTTRIDALKASLCLGAFICFEGQFSQVVSCEFGVLVLRVFEPRERVIQVQLGQWVSEVWGRQSVDGCVEVER